MARTLRAIVDVVAGDHRRRRAALDAVPDQLAAEETVADAQHRAAVDVKSVLEKRRVGVPVIDEGGVAHHDDLVGVVAGENALLIAGEQAVLNDQLGRRKGILVADTRAIAAQGVRDVRALEGQPVHRQAGQGEDDAFLVGQIDRRIQHDGLAGAAWIDLDRHWPGDGRKIIRVKYPGAPGHRRRC